MDVPLERRGVGELRAIAAAYVVDIKGLPEKKDIAGKLRQELREKHGVANPDSIQMASLQASSAPTPPGPGPSPSPHEADHACASPGQGLSPSPMPVSPMPDTIGQVDTRMTQELSQTMFLAMQQELQGRMQAQHDWHALPDGVGRVRFVHVTQLEDGNQSPQFFYPSLMRASRRLVFECLRWRQPEVVLEPYVVLCRCPAQQVWPYCMLCHKFCWGDHMESTKHRQKVKWWREVGDTQVVMHAFEREPRFPAFQ